MTQLEAKPRRSGCPCLYTTPCSARCTCVTSHSSYGCRFCASYGSREQRVAAAERLAGLDRLLTDAVMNGLAARLTDAEVIRLKAAIATVPEWGDGHTCPFCQGHNPEDQCVRLFGQQLGHTAGCVRKP